MSRTIAAATPSRDALDELPPRRHAADHCFDRLARAILQGDLAPGERLPPERLLAERYAVSKLVVRQAVHRLNELGLVRVRQGGPTLVLDPDVAADMRVVALRYRLGPSTAEGTRELLEVQLLRGHALLTLAEIEGDRGELSVLPQIVDDYAAAGAPTGAGMRAFEERYWTAVARAGGNRIYITEHAWWYRLLDEYPAAHHPALAAPPQRIAFYRELTRRLITDGGAAKMYLDVARGLLAVARKPRRRSP